MTDHTPMYCHTQRAPLCLMLYALSITFLTLSWLFRTEPVIPGMFLFAACVTLVLAGAFHQLTVEDTGDSLLIRFGPVPLFRRTVSYADISGVEVSQTTLLDGWGIHRSLQGGWVWNLWGRDCVVIRKANGTLRVGSDDAKQLAIFLKQQLTGDSETGEINRDWRRASQKDRSMNSPSKFTKL